MTIVVSAHVMKNAENKKRINMLLEQLKPKLKNRKGWKK